MPFGKFTAFISGNVQAYQEILQNPLQTVSRSFMHKQFRTVAGLDGVLFMEGEIHSKHHKVYMKGLNASNRTVPKIVRKYMEEYCANNGRFPWWKSSRSKSVSDQEFIVSSFDGDCLVLATRVWLDIFFGAQSVQTMLENPDSASVLHELMETLMTYDSNNLLTSTKAKSMLVAIFNRVLNALQILKDKYQFEPDSGCLYAEFLKEPRSPQIEHEYEQELVHGWAAHKAIYVVIGFAMNELIFLPHFQAKLQAILSDPADDADSKAEVYLRYLLEETNRIYPISRYNARRAGVPFSVSYDENGQRINPDSGMKAKAALQLTVNTGNEVGLLPTLSNHDSAFWRGALGSIHPFQFETDRWQHLDEMGRKRENAQSAEEEQKEREKDKDYGFSTVTRQLSSRDFITLPALPLPLALRGSSSAAVSADVTYAHIPFLCGRRQCLGKILALRTFISVISVVLGQFWVLPDLENGSQRVVTKGGRFYPSLVNPLVVKFVRRNTSGFATQ